MADIQDMVADAAVTSGQKFSPNVCEKIGWYVYALRDPRSGEVFYVGKGKGNRVFAHAIEAEASDGVDELSEKLDLIKQIHEDGKSVDALIIRHGLASETLAYEIEASVIDAYSLVSGGMAGAGLNLVNGPGGHHSATRGLASTAVVASLYEAEPAPDITESALVIRIPGLWTPAMSDAELYEATRQWWKLGPRRENADFAFSVNHGVIREVYRIEPGSWVGKRFGKARRWGFAGAVDPELAARYKNKSVRHIFKQGAANPIRYVNC